MRKIDGDTKVHTVVCRKRRRKRRYNAEKYLALSISFSMESIPKRRRVGTQVSKSCAKTLPIFDENSEIEGVSSIKEKKERDDKGKGNLSLSSLIRGKGAKKVKRSQERKKKCHHLPPPPFFCERQKTPKREMGGEII